MTRAVLAAVLLLTTALPQRAHAMDARLDATPSAQRSVSSILRQLRFTPDSRLLATTETSGAVTLWRVPQLERVSAVQHPGGATSVSFAPDGAVMATAGYDGKVRTWRTADGTLLRTLPGHTGTVWTLAHSPDGTLLASAGEDRAIRLWRTSDGAPVRTLAGHARNVWSVAFSPDGQWLASGSFDYSVKLWDVASGRLARTFAGHEQAVVSVDFSPRGDLVASSGDDSVARLWRLDGTPAHVLAGGSDHLYSVRFSPDGRWLATAGREKGALATLWKQYFGRRFLSRDPTIRLWRVQDGALQQALDAHEDDVWSVAFSPDGQWLASAGADKVVRLWRLEVR